MEGATMLAGARPLVGVERREQRRQVLDDILDLHLDSMHPLTALEAEPFEAVDITLAPSPFDDQADRARDRPLRRMTRVRPDQEYIAFPDLHVVDLAVLGDLENHVALELIEEFLDRIVVEIDPLVRAADDHHRHVGIAIEQLLVADRRFEELLVLGDPALEVECLETRMLQHMESLSQARFELSFTHHQCAVPHTRFATSTTRLSFFFSSSIVTGFPLKSLEKPHCGLRHSWPTGINLLASSMRPIS